MNNSDMGQPTDAEQATPTLTIRDQVRESLGNLGDRTRKNVIEHFAAKEAERRATAMIGGLDKLTTFERDLDKIRPQPAGFDEEGKPVGNPVFSKQQIEERDKIKKQIDKLTKAINKADDNNDFGDLFDLTKGG